MTKRKKKIIIWTVSLALSFAIVFGGCAIYVSDFYRADNDAVSSFITDYSVEANEIRNGVIVFEPSTSYAGFIFYPGGKVEHTAYIPLMTELAENGILCILLEMPFNLAVLDMNAAKGVCDDYPEIKSWYIGGHSLGGSMAASFVAKYTEDFNGLILLGSYSTEAISIPVLSIYGSEDRVMNREKYDKYKPNIGSDLTEVVIEGGCHAYFGMYGAQDGDGTPSISNKEQIILTTEEIIKFIN